jgi:hypothetical protein
VYYLLDAYKNFINILILLSFTIRKELFSIFSTNPIILLDETTNNNHHNNISPHIKTHPATTILPFWGSYPFGTSDNAY